MSTLSSRELLWKLIEERIEPGADRDAIDARIRELFEEEWSVVFTDLVGFSRRTEEFGILHFLSLIFEKERLLRGPIEEGGGRIIKQEGDSWMILFRSPLRAVEAMLVCQRTCAEHNLSKRPEDQVRLCLGIGYGKMLRIGDEDVWGKEVNIASRLGEDSAQGGEIMVSGAVKRAVEGRVSGISFERREVERISEPCWLLCTDGP